MSITDFKRGSSNSIRPYMNLSTPVGLKTQISRLRDLDPEKITFGTNHELRDDTGFDIHQ